MRVTVLSGFGIKGPACFLLECMGARLLLDCGEGPDAGRRPDLSGVGRVDAVLFSHGHVDHTGALDLAVTLGNPPLYATAPVRALAKQPALREAHDLPLAGGITIAGVAVATGLCGHAPGALWLQIGGADGLLYSGDFSRDSLLFPYQDPPKTRFCLMDCSYGAYDEPLGEGMAFVDDCASEGPLVLPAPAGGRGLEMALHLFERGHGVQLCATHRQALGAMIAADAVALTPNARQRLERLRAGALPLDPLGAIDDVALVTPADGSSGEAAALMARIDGRQPFQCLFTGHLGEASPARRLVEAGLARHRRWNVHPRLSDLKAFLAAAQPQLALPVFLRGSAIPELLTAMDGFPLAPTAAAFEAAVAQSSFPSNKDF